MPPIGSAESESKTAARTCDVSTSIASRFILRTVYGLPTVKVHADYAGCAVGISFDELEQFSEKTGGDAAAGALQLARPCRRFQWILPRFGSRRSGPLRWPAAKRANSLR